MEAAPRAAVQLPHTQPRLSRALSFQKLVSYKIWQLPEAELPYLLQSLEIIHIAIPPCSLTVVSRELSLLPSTCEVHKKEQGIEGSQYFTDPEDRYGLHITLENFFLESQNYQQANSFS